MYFFSPFWNEALINGLINYYEVARNHYMSDI